MVVIIILVGKLLAFSVLSHSVIQITRIVTYSFCVYYETNYKNVHRMINKSFSEWCVKWTVPFIFILPFFLTSFVSPAVIQLTEW